METVVPKLVAEDIPLLYSLLSDVFPGIEYQPAEMTALRREIKKVCKERYLTYGEQEEQGSQWVSKVTHCLNFHTFTVKIKYLKKKSKELHVNLVFNCNL